VAGRVEDSCEFNSIVEFRDWPEIYAGADPSPGSAMGGAGFASFRISVDADVGFALVAQTH
jgi:hypothetical protein